MSDQKISELTEKTSPADADLLAIVDSEAVPHQTKKIKPLNLGIGTLGASAWVVANNASAKIKTSAQKLQSLGYPVWVCDGTDDQTEIQAAHDALPANGGTIQLSEGYFYLNKQAGKTYAILIKGNDRALVGVGSASYLILKANQDCDIIQVGDGTTDYSRNRIADLMMWGEKANNVSGSGIYILRAGYCSLDNLTISMTKEHGIRKNQSGGGPLWLSNIVIQSVGGNGIELTENQPDGVLATNVEVSWMDGYGINLYNVQGTHWANLHCVNGNSDGVHAVMSGVWIRNFVSQDNKGFGVFANAGEVVIDGGQIRTCNEQGIKLHQIYAALISGMVMYQNCLSPTAGTPLANIWMWDQGWHMIVNNRIGAHTSTSYSIYEDTPSQPSLIEGNWVDQPIHTEHAATRVRNNVGHITENSGTATVASAATTVVVSHGLVTTPTRVLLTARLWSNAAKAWITNLTATQFTINVDVDPGAGIAVFDWRAQVGEG